jgi:radical SAM superfamily enzyme YgiQ (UPF0313 family)
MLQKDLTTNQLLYSAAQCAKYDIVPEYSFMAGMPGEKTEDVKKTVNLIGELVKTNPKTEIIGPQPFRPYPGSQLYEECIKAGWKEPASLQEWAELMEHEWNFLPLSAFPWVENPDYVEALWPYLNYALTPKEKLLGSGVKVNKIFKILFIAASKMRWKLKFFDFPIEYKVAKRFMTRGG